MYHTLKLTEKSTLFLPDGKIDSCLKDASCISGGLKENFAHLSISAARDNKGGALSLSSIGHFGHSRLLDRYAAGLNSGTKDRDPLSADVPRRPIEAVLEDFIRVFMRVNFPHGVVSLSLHRQRGSVAPRPQVPALPDHRRECSAALERR